MKTKNNEHLLIFDFGEKKSIYGQEIRFYEKKVGNFSTSKCAKKLAFKIIQFFEDTLLDKEAP